VLKLSDRISIVSKTKGFAEIEHKQEQEELNKM
jgi:hypothetical protein